MAGVKVEFKGKTEFYAKLAKLGIDARQTVEQKVKFDTLAIHKEVIESMQKTSQGERVKRYGGQNPGRTVTVSKPGDPPNVDQRGLINSYQFNIDGFYGEVGSNLAYARHLEFGARSINLEARPHLRPAFKRVVGKNPNKLQLVGDKDPKFKLEKK